MAWARRASRVVALRHQGGAKGIRGAFVRPQDSTGVVGADGFEPPTYAL
jgi:hypothetical protein